MANRYLTSGMADEAQRYLSLVVDNRPNDLPARLSLFSLAMELNDDQGMVAAQKKILDIVKDKNDSSYLFTEARRRLSQLRRGQLEKDAIPGIRQLINDALAQRPDWHELHLVSAELELAAGNAQSALQDLAKAQEAGRPNPRAVALHIRLLADIGENARAAELLERIPKPSRQALLGNLYTEILFRTNKVDEAIQEARAAAEADPENPQKRLWYGQLLARSTQLPNVTEAKRKSAAADAIAALRQAVKLEPELPDAWYTMISLNAQQKDVAAAQQALRDAQLYLSGDNLQLFLAKSYEALGRPFDAETMYRAVYEVDPKDVRRVQQLAAFYLSPLYQARAANADAATRRLFELERNAKLAPLLNQILRAAEEVDADGKPVLAANDPNLLWARREGAKLLAATGDYQNLIKAEKLLASSSQNGVLYVEDRLQMAELLDQRPEPESRQRAILLLEEISALQRLTEQGELALGRLYFKTGKWPDCRQQMLETIAKFPKFADAYAAYVDMLLIRGDYEEAKRWLEELNKLAPSSKATFALTAKLAGKLGKQNDVVTHLRSRLPKVSDPKQITDAQADLMAFLANLLIEVGDVDTAEKTYRQLVERDPRMVFGLATFLGTHRDVGQCFELLASAYKPDNVQQVVTVGVNVLRKRRGDVGEKYDAQLEDWLNRGLRDNPDSISLQMLRADFYDVQKKFDEAVAVYNSLLTRNDLTGFARAVVLNNLSYLIALAGSAAKTDVDPLELVEEAEQILGPNADILDTKAVVLIERKQYQDAIDELKLSVTDNPTGAKYFHMVVAHLRAGEKRAALDAWDKAEEAGLTRDELNLLEHARYDEIKVTIDQLRASNAAVDQPTRLQRAG
jgi:tetratricopeptide (TPR) repeat protein